METILYFDYMAVPLYLILLYSSIARGMTKGRSSRIFNWILLTSVIATFSDLGLELLVRVTPVPGSKLILANFFAYSYFLFHNGTGFLYFL
ncbi:MAG: hypothetical protein IKQ28_08050, partial [Lachnospiraceae bacterium]|nr:hypothetical protein [Lachnospiraceae bacterium]